VAKWPLSGTAGDKRVAREKWSPTPRVFCEKSLDLLDYKGVEFFGNDKEFAIVSKQRS
jgi:hypothetical protein